MQEFLGAVESLNHEEDQGNQAGDPAWPGAQSEEYTQSILGLWDSPACVDCSGPNLRSLTGCLLGKIRAQ